MSGEDAPRFSLVMPAYNASATIGRAIESVLAQTYAGWELIVVDDGSADDTGDIAQAYAIRDRRIRVLSQANAGSPAARREGALHARGEFVTRMDADDELTVDALARLSSAIDAEPDFDIYSVHGYKVYTDGSRREIFGDLRFQRLLSLTIEDLIDDCWIFSGAASIRRDVLERLGGFRPDRRAEDYDLWVRALAQGAAHLHVPAHAYLWYMDVPGHVTENPVPSFRSYISSLQDLIGEGVLTDAQVALAHASIANFEERIRQLEETGTTDAAYTDAQAQRFKEGVTRVFGARLGAWVLRGAERAKWMVKPVRVWLARRRRARDAERSRG